MIVRRSTAPSGSRFPQSRVVWNQLAGVFELLTGSATISSAILSTLTQSPPEMLARRRRESWRSNARGRRHLVVNPAIRLLETITQARGRLPAKKFADQSVIAVASVNAFGRRQV